MMEEAKKITGTLRRVAKKYSSPYERTVEFHKGERLRYERRESEWSGWLWGSTAAGECAWVPEAWVRIEGDYCVMARDYTARELSVTAGDTVRTTIVESGWAWATTPAGQTGWVPLDCLEGD